MNFKFKRNRKRADLKNGWSGKNHKQNMIISSLPKINIEDDYVFVENVFIENVGNKRKKKVLKLSKFFKLVLKHYPKLKQYWKDSELLSDLSEESLLTDSFQKEFIKILKIEIKHIPACRLKFLYKGRGKNNS